MTTCNHLRIPTLTAKQQRRFYRCVASTSRGCWLWKGQLDEHGRARFKVNGVRFIAARIMYSLVRGMDPGKFKVLHSCDNPACINPKHLRRGTQTENVAEMCSKGRHGRAGARPGESHHNAKLTKRRVLAIVRSKESNVKLAARYGVSPSLISMVRHGKGWKHVKR